MFTVTKLARQCGLSRTALLYYESIGLMPSPLRSGGNYRCYGEADLRRLLQIRAYRDAGLKLEDIRALLGANADSRASDAARGSTKAPDRAGCRNQDFARASARNLQTA